MQKWCGYEKAKNLMKQLDWKMRVTMDGLEILHIEVYHPKRETVYTVRRDTGKRLMAECRVCGRMDDDTAILCYDHDEANEDLI